MSGKNKTNTEFFRPSPDDSILKTFYDNADVGIYICDYYTGEIIMCNDLYTKRLGKSCEQLVGCHCYKVLGYETRCPFCPYEKLLDDKGKPLGSYIWELYLEKVGVWLQVINKAVEWADGRLAHMVTFIDITEKYQTNNNPNLLVFQDRNLLIPNRSCMEFDIRSINKPCTLVVLDVKGMRKINSLYGRHCGDLFLKSIRDYILELNIPNSALYRLEAGDFGILLKDTKPDSGEPQQLAEKIFDRFHYAWSLPIGDRQQNIFASVVICVVPANIGDNTSFGTLYDTIEHTLGFARVSGGMAFYNNYIHEKFNKGMQLELSLRNAVRDNMKGFHVAYQPIVEPGVAVWSGVEALCRWNCPEFGNVSPLEFIPLAESCGLIGAIGNWILERSLIDVKSWGLDKSDRFFLEINLSPFQLSIKNLDIIISNLLKKYDYPANKLCLEVTKFSELNYSRHTLEAIEKLSRLGVAIALDDFGTGYSSFTNLYRLPIKILKTDHSLVTELENDSRMQHLLQVMVELAHSANMKIVAEGVETDFQARMLVRQGVDFLQGYYFSKPVSSEQIEKKISNFYDPLRSLLAMGYTKFDISMLSSNIGYEMNPSLNKIINRCMRELFANPDGDAAIDIALSHIGKSLNVSRAYVFLKEADGTFSNTHEWCAPGIVAEKEFLQHISVEHIINPWTTALKQDGMLIASDIRNLDSAVYDILEKQGIKALVEFPILEDGELYGFVGFDDCEDIHVWTKEEIQMLHTLTGIITATLGKMWLQKELEAQGKRQEAVLNNMDTVIYVTDLETNEILFANSAIRNLYNNDNLEGRICWEALQCLSERCSFCPVPHLLEYKDSCYQWEHYNSIVKRHFRIRDSIIPWSGSKLAHLEYAVDITELKNSQQRLEIYASTDMFTETLNRSSFSASAQKLLEAANNNCFPVTIAFIDIDNLKKVNDTLGHAAGDELIERVVKSLRNSIRDSDYIGRYGGDEFVIAFNKCPKNFAQQRMEDSLLKLKESAQGNSGNLTFVFSYGLAETTEVPFTTAEEHYSELISLADKRMFEHKRRKSHNV